MATRGNQSCPARHYLNMSSRARVLDSARLGVVALLLSGCPQRQLGDAVAEASDEGSTGASEPAENQPPIARVDTLFTRQNQPLTIGPDAILANDLDPDGDSLFATILRPDTRGRVQVEDGTITYTPPEDFWGVDRFAYEIDDGRGGLANTEVLVYVAPTRVELDTIVHDQRGFEVEWQNLSDLQGVAGDVDGNGVDDLLFRPDDQQGPDGGTIAVVLLDADGIVKRRLEIALDAYEPVAGAAGDFNGDGLADIVVGGCCSENNTNLHVVFGKTDTEPVDVQVPGDHSVSVSDSGYIPAPASIGSSEINGDGLSDVIAIDVASQAMFVLYGGSETEDVALSDLAEGDPRGFVLPFDKPVFHAVGDVNADGFGDLLRSRTVVLGGAYEGTVSDLYEQDRAFDVFLPEAGWPESADAAGDFNGDGFGDMLLGRTDVDPTGVWIVFGKDDTAKVELDDLDQGVPVGAAIHAPPDYSGFGAQIAGLGDVNGDGRGDVVVSALQVDSGPDRARAWVVYGDEQRTSINVGSIAGNAGGFEIEYPQSNVNRFQPWVGAGEFNDDGIPDIVLGSDGLQDWSVKVVFGVPTQDTCCIAHAGHGCTNPEVATCVCESLPGCCEDAWGNECIAAVADGCGLCPA